MFFKEDIKIACTQIKRVDIEPFLKNDLTRYLVSGHNKKSQNY
jgi:hypothetical protein